LGSADVCVGGGEGGEEGGEEGDNEVEGDSEVEDSDEAMGGSSGGVRYGVEMEVVLVVEGLFVILRLTEGIGIIGIGVYGTLIVDVSDVALLVASDVSGGERPDRAAKLEGHAEPPNRFATF
jgi:hypothetical protein